MSVHRINMQESTENFNKKSYNSKDSYKIVCRTHTNIKDAKQVLIIYVRTQKLSPKTKETGVRCALNFKSSALGRSLQRWKDLHSYVQLRKRKIGDLELELIEK